MSFQDKFSKKDFDNMTIPVHLMVSGSILSACPELDQYPEFSAKLPPGLSRNKVIAYIVYCYDKKSPFRIHEENLIKRKIMSAKQAGFQIGQDGTIEPLAKLIIQGKNIAVNAMILRYGRHFHGLLWSFMVAGLENLYNVLWQVTNNGDRDVLEMAEGEDKFTASKISEKDLLKLAKDKVEIFTKARQQLTEIESMIEEAYGDKTLLDVIDQFNEEEQATQIGGGIVELFAKKAGDKFYGSPAKF